MSISLKDKQTYKKTETDEILDELTPTEQMDVAFKSINDDLAADLLQRVLDMSPKLL